MNIVANGSFADYGSGGLIGSISSSTVLIEDIYFEGVVTTTGHHAGGLIGAILSGSNVTVRRAVVYGLDTNNSTYGIRASSTNMYAGAFVGINQGTLSITDALFRGRLRAATNNYYGIQVANGTNATGSNIRAVAMSTYNGNTLNNINQTRWNAMTGQKPTWNNGTNGTYISNITTLNSSWWNTNFANITSRPAIWQYNSTTRLYQIIP